MIEIKVSGSFKKTNRFLLFLYKSEFGKHLDALAQKGVDALKSATPVDTGETADSWGYKIYKSVNHIKIEWTNTHLDDEGRIPVAILLQYGHATGWHTYVEGVDFINPAIQPIFDEIANEIWEEVTNA